MTSSKFEFACFIMLLVVFSADCSLTLDGWFNCSESTFSQSTQTRRLRNIDVELRTSRRLDATLLHTAECGKYTVPLCYTGVCSNNGTIEVFVKRIVAGNVTSNKVLWVFQGGPGESSVNCTWLS